MNNPLFHYATKQFRVETAKVFGQKLLFIIGGVLLGWSLAHHFVYIMGGAWPDRSVVAYIFECYGYLGGATGLAIIVSLFRKVNRRQTD
jgi:hypothetical protein